MVFEDLNSEYSILDFSLSHSQLLLRSKINTERNYNIDILFKSVNFISIPITIKGIKISAVIDNKRLSKISKEFNLLNDSRLIEIVDGKGFNFYLAANSMGVFHNKLDILETSIGRYDFSDHKDEEIDWIVF